MNRELINEAMQIARVNNDDSYAFFVINSYFFIDPYVLSGGWASGSCPHMVVYCLTFVLRGESPRDYADLLRSLKFPPSISICDIPQRLATHVNNRVPSFFAPHDGMLFPSTEENFAAAEQGVLERSLPWIHNEGAPSFPSSALRNETPETDREELLHPTKKVADRYCLSDRFHETNSSQKEALLRWVTLVPELNGIVNTEAEEQLHSIIDRSNYCLNTMKPVNHLFMMRLKIHLHNAGINSAFRRKVDEDTFSAQAGYAVETELEHYGRLLLRPRNARCIPRPGYHSSDNLPSSPSPAASPVPIGKEDLQWDESDAPLSPIIPVSASKSKPGSKAGSGGNDSPSNKSSFETEERTSKETKRTTETKVRYLNLRYSSG